MTAILTPAATTPGGGPAAHSRRLIAVLSVTQTVGYGVLSYAFPVLLTPIAHELGASTATVTGAFTAAIVAAAAASIPVGRWLDKQGGRALLTFGSATAAALVLAWSQVTTIWQLYAVFVLIGLASATMLYEAAFPVIVAATRPERRDNALLAVTIVAGFASSIFFPLTGLLLERHGWRTTLVILAVLLAAITIPAHLLAVPGRRQHQTRTAGAGSGVREALRDKAFWLLAAAFVVHGAAISAVGVLLVTYLLRAGHTATAAATLSGLLGILSVTGRLTTTGLSKRFGMTAVTAAVFAAQAFGAAALPFLGGTIAGAGACIVAFGLGFGVATIARPAILAARYGTSRYATIAGIMTMPITLAKAGAPLAAAAVAPNTFMAAAAIACGTSALLLLRISR
ncbi:MFS transporter [Rhizocola hellebori]|uniref:MFS transporter n=1 Tax=Rhizocola hellebori TaxID=1392758 RepID=A0A8J3Q574_9ACTN|nr:MFS transporter [Rhizocola hellebori]GIH03662.1 MFS transporter [Rhizocola hellebori]